jgi:glucose/mannose-6-phosphate isomerase
MLASNSTHKSLLDDRVAVGKLDVSNALGSIESLADQVRQAWDSVKNLQFNPQQPIENVVVAGMGGSALGADVAKHLFKDRLKVPFEVVNSYHLPNYVNSRTLVILSSYSGSTEEVINCAAEAKKNQAQIMFICAGGKLAEIAKAEGYPGYVINPEFNPSGQPRMAIGYSVIGLLSLLAKANVFELSHAEVEEVILTITRTDEMVNVDVPQADNLSKLVAFECLERRPVFVASDFLSGAVHVSTNQFNENAKIFADFKIIPELNHHLMEGLKFPKSNALNHLFLFVNSDLYEPRIKKRMKLTQEIVEQNEIETYEVKLKSETKLTQAFELITLMAYANFYLSMLEGIDPSPIPYVDWFKTQLE